jgi:hypothetical protein
VRRGVRDQQPGPGGVQLLRPAQPRPLAHRRRVEHQRHQHRRRRAGGPLTGARVHVQLLPAQVLQLAGAGRAPERARPTATTSTWRPCRCTAWDCPSGIQAHPEQHGRHAAEPRPARGLLAPMPFFVGDEELSFGCWPGNFRAAAEPAGSAVVAVEEPDLTLRL